MTCLQMISNGLRADGVLLVREEVLEYENLTDRDQDHKHGLRERPVGHSGVQMLGALSTGRLVQLVVRLIFEQSVQRLVNVVHALLDLLVVDDRLGERMEEVSHFAGGSGRFEVVLNGSGSFQSIPNGSKLF